MTMPHAPSTWKGFTFIAVTTAVAILFVDPLIEQLFQSVFKKSAENVLSFGKAS